VADAPEVRELVFATVVNIGFDATVGVDVVGVVVFTVVVVVVVFAGVLVVDDFVVNTLCNDF
jgi:hypothetical protein